MPPAHQRCTWHPAVCCDTTTWCSPQTRCNNTALRRCNNTCAEAIGGGGGLVQAAAVHPAMQPAGADPLGAKDPAGRRWLAELLACEEDEGGADRAAAGDGGASSSSSWSESSQTTDDAAATETTAAAGSDFDDGSDENSSSSEDGAVAAAAATSSSPLPAAPLPPWPPWPPEVSTPNSAANLTPPPPPPTLLRPLEAGGVWTPGALMSGLAKPRYTCGRPLPSLPSCAHHPPSLPLRSHGPQHAKAAVGWWWLWCTVGWCGQVRHSSAPRSLASSSSGDPHTPRPAPCSAPSPANRMLP